MAKDNDKKSTIEKLQKVSALYSELNSYEEYALFDVNNDDANWNKNVQEDDIDDIKLKLSLITDNVPEEPEQKKLELPKLPQSSLISKFSYSATFLFLMAITLLAVIVIISFAGSDNNLFSNVWGILILIVIDCFIFGYSISKIKLIGMFSDILGKKAKANYPNLLEKFEQDIKYNKEEYPKLLVQYNEQITLLKEQYVKKVNECHKRIAQIWAEINEFNIVPKNMFHKIDYIIELLNFGRADNLKEALNITVQEQKEDEHRQAILREEQRKSEMLQKEINDRQAELERHNREVERQNEALVRSAEQQAEETKRQTQYAKSQAEESKRQTQILQDQASFNSNKCFSCQKGSYCQRDSHHCTGFVPRGI